MAVPAPEGDRGVYGISVAADLVGMGVPNLRLYEACGLLQLQRTDGGTSRYGANDLDRLRRMGTCSRLASTWPASAWSCTWRPRTLGFARTGGCSMARRGDDQLDTTIPEADRLEQAQQADPKAA